LGTQLGRPAASVHGELRRLAGAGLITLNADSRGTVITLAPGVRPN
jgi:predicted transcriptional regulator